MHDNKKNMGNKQDCPINYDLIGIKETWWDDCHDWNISTEVYTLLDQQVRKKGGGTAVYVC